MDDAEGVRRAFRCVRGLASDTRDFLEAIRLLASDLADGERLSVIEDGLRLANDALDRINAGLFEHAADFDLAEQANIDHATPIQVGTEWHNFAFAAIRDTAFVCSRAIGGLLPVWSDSARRIAPVFAGDEGTPHYGDARLERECRSVLERLDGFTPERIARLLAVLDLEEARTLRSIEDCPPEDPQRAPKPRRKKRAPDPLDQVLLKERVLSALKAVGRDAKVTAVERELRSRGQGMRRQTLLGILRGIRGN